MATDKVIKVKRSKDEKLLMEYAESRIKLATRLFLIIQNEDALNAMAFESQDQHIVHLALHLVYLDQMFVNSMKTNLTVDQWRQCELVWSDFYRSAGNIYSAVKGVILLVEHWHNIKFILKTRYSAYSIELGDREEPMAELSMKLRDGTGYSFCSGPIFQFVEATYFGSRFEVPADLAYWNREVKFSVEGLPAWKPTSTQS